MKQEVWFGELVRVRKGIFIIEYWNKVFHSNLSPFHYYLSYIDNKVQGSNPAKANGGVRKGIQPYNAPVPR